MSLLTIAIPTYNRAEKALNQIKGLLNQIERDRLSEKVSLIVSDNASTDATRDIVKPLLASAGQLYQCNSRNIGAAANYARCFQLSQGKYTWVVGDDDEIDDQCVAYVAQQLSINADIKALFLNFRQRDGFTDAIISEAYYSPDLCRRGQFIKDVRSLLASVHYSAWLWMTGSIVSTRDALSGISLAQSRSNTGLPLFVAIYCASQGPWRILSEVQATMVLGNNGWSRIYARRLYGIDIPACLRRLRRNNIDVTNVLLFRELLRRRWVAIMGDLRRRGYHVLIDAWNA